MCGATPKSSFQIWEWLWHVVSIPSVSRCANAACKYDAPLFRIHAILSHRQTGGVGRASTGRGRDKGLDLKHHKRRAAGALTNQRLPRSVDALFPPGFLDAAVLHYQGEGSAIQVRLASERGSITHRISTAFT